MYCIAGGMGNENELGVMKWLMKLPIFSVFIGVWALTACSSSSHSHSSDRSSAPSDYGATASRGEGFVASAPSKSPSALYREANVKKYYIPNGKHARKYKRRLDPKYITIHSTQNFSTGADAWRHAKALNNGKLRARKRKGGNRIGYLTWHFTVDQNVVVQHLPSNEQGEHADFDGPGNNTSLGIEMCEHKGNSRAATIERTAKLTAWLMHKHNIPLRRVVAHYHWERKGLSTPHKNCPHFLMDNGRPGAKWQWFLSKVNKHYKSITSGSPSVVPRPTSVASNSQQPSYPVTSDYQPLSTSRPVVSQSAANPSTRYHIVRSGDTLYSLSRRYNTSVSAIQRANGMSSTAISRGKTLRIPR